VSLEILVKSIPGIAIGALVGGLTGYFGSYATPTAIRKSFDFIDEEIDMIARKSDLYLRFENTTSLITTIVMGSRMFYEGIVDGLEFTQNHNYAFIAFNSVSIAYEIYRRTK